MTLKIDHLPASCVEICSKASLTSVLITAHVARPIGPETCVVCYPGACVYTNEKVGAEVPPADGQCPLCRDGCEDFGLLQMLDVLQALHTSK